MKSYSAFEERLINYSSESTLKNAKQLLKTIHITVDDVMDDCGLPLLGIVPEDPNVVLAAAFHKSLLRQTRKGAAAACRRIAKRIQGLPVPIAFR